jgi:DNA polymerase III epsilon subunit-like protein
MIVIDLEMSAPDAQEGAIISLGAIDFERPATRMHLECRLRDGAKWDREAERIHGLTKLHLSTCLLSERDIVEQFLAWAARIHDRTLAGQAAHNDWMFLQAACKRYGFPWPFGHRLVDLHSVVYSIFVGNGHKLPIKQGVSDLSLDTILVHLGLPKRTGAHDALNDALLETECFSRLLLGENLLDEFKQFPVLDARKQPKIF